MQTVLNMRENELEARQMELAKILSALNSQKEKLQSIIQAQEENKANLEALNTAEELDIIQVQMHQGYVIKLNNDAILKYKQKEVLEAHKKVEVLKKLKEKQEKEYYKEFLQAEAKEIDDITSARFKLNDTGIN